MHSIKKTIAKPKIINFYDLFLLFVGNTSLISIGLLCVNQFQPILSLIMGISITSCLIFFFEYKPIIQVKKIDLPLIVILLIATILRYNPSLYLVGGQDPGLYTIMSKQYERNQSMFYEDKLQNVLNYDQSAIYNQNQNHNNNYFSVSTEHDNKYVLLFYPLFPTWISIFSSVFGQNLSMYSLTLFSIISIISIYELGYLISGNKKSGYIASFLLAINPLHIFFSKFPVTEILSLALVSSGFLYLYKYILKGKSHTIYLLLSLLLFSSFFYARISAFMYIPFFIFIYLYFFLYSNRNSRKKINIYFIALSFSFVLSLCFYYLFLPQLFFIMYSEYVIKLFLPNPLTKITILGLVILLSILFIKFQKFFDIKKIQTIIIKSIPLIFLLILIYSIYRLYLLSSTNFFINDPWYERWNLVNSGIYTVKHSSLYATLLYLSPIGFILIFLFPFFNKNSIFTKLIFLEVFFIEFWIINNCLGKMEVPYHYYYSRYLLSELIPAGVLLVSCYIGYIDNHKAKKILNSIFIILITLCYIPFSFIQFNKQENTDINQIYKISRFVKPNDLLYLIKDNFGFHNDLIKSPLLGYFNLNVFSIDKTNDLLSEPLQNLNSQFNSVFILTGEEIKQFPTETILMESITYKIKHFSNDFHAMDSQLTRINNPTPFPFYSYLPPSDYVVKEQLLYLYSLDTSQSINK